MQYEITNISMLTYSDYAIDGGLNLKMTLVA